MKVEFETEHKRKKGLDLHKCS